MLLTIDIAGRPARRFYVGALKGCGSRQRCAAPTALGRGGKSSGEWRAREEVTKARGNGGLSDHPRGLIENSKCENRNSGESRAENRNSGILERTPIRRLAFPADSWAAGEEEADGCRFIRG